MKSRKGVTLLELLVAMALVTIVGYLAFDLLKDENQNYVRIREKVKLQGDARDAMRIMESELRNAGFAVQAQAAPIYNKAAHCNEAWFDAATGTAIDPTNNSTSLSTGDEIAFRGYQLGNNGTLPTSCATGASGLFQEVGYRLRNGSLQRYFRNDVSSTPKWVPFLNDVVSFQVQYGMVGTPGAGAIIGDPLTIMNLSNWQTTGTISSSSGVVSMTGWSATSAKIWSTKLVGFNVKRGQRYKVTFSIAGDLGTGILADATTGTVTGYDRTQLFAGLRAGPRFLDSLTVWAGDSANLSPISTELYFTVPKDTTDVQIAIKGKLLPGATAGSQVMRIENLRIEQVGSGTFDTWLNDPTNAQLGKVKAVRITLLAKTQDKNKEGVKASFTGPELGDSLLPDYTASGADTAKSHILLQRVIPVVNNGL